MLRFQRFVHHTMIPIWSIATVHILLMLLTDMEAILAAAVLATMNMFVVQWIRKTQPREIDHRQTFATIAFKVLLLGVLLVTTQAFTAIPACQEANSEFCIIKTVGVLATFFIISIVILSDTVALFVYSISDARKKVG